MGKISENEQDKVTCWICFEFLESPITLVCSHTFCHACIVKAYKKSPICPFCRRDLKPPFPGVNQEIEALVTKVKADMEDIDSSTQFSNPCDQEQAPILDIPEDNLVDVLTHLQPNDIYKVSMTCTYLNELCNDNWLWREMTIKTFPFLAEDGGSSWKNRFKLRKKTQKGWDEGRSGDFKVTSMREHKDYISTFEIYKRNIVTASNDKTIRLWHMNSRSSIYTLKEHNALVNDIKFNELNLVSGGEDKTCHMWDTITGTHTAQFDHNSPVSVVELSDKMLYAAGNTVKVFDLKSHSQVSDFSNNQIPIKKLIVSGGHIIVHAEESVKVYDSRYLSESILDFNRTYVDVDYANGNVFLAEDNSVTMVNLSSELKTQIHNDVGIRLVKADHEKLVVSGSSLQVIDLQNGGKKSLNVSTSRCNHFSFDDRKLVAAFSDNTVKVFDMCSNKQLYLLLGGSLQGRNGEDPNKHGCSRVRFDQKRIIGSFGGILKVYQFG